MSEACWGLLKSAKAPTSNSFPSNNSPFPRPIICRSPSSQDEYISFSFTDAAVKKLIAGTYFFSRIFPESPRWLIAHDRLDEAQSIIERFGDKNDKPVDSEVLRALLENVRRDQLEREREAKKYTPIDLFRTPKLRKWAVIFCYQWYKSQHFLNY